MTIRNMELKSGKVNDLQYPLVAKLIKRGSK